MGKNPAFQFYPSDWARDMIEHPLEVEGFWIRICCILWWSPTRGTATKPANIWAKTAAVSAQKCRVLFAYLHKQNIADVEVDNDVYKVTSRRMVRDEHIRNIRSIAGSLGGNPKIKGYPKSESLVNQNTKESLNSLVKLNPTPSSSSSSSNKKNKHIAIVLPDEIKKETWDAYREMRQRKRAPLTDRAAVLILAELEKLRLVGNPPEDVLNQSIMKSWTGVFPLSRGGNGDGQGDFGRSRSSFSQKGRGKEDSGFGIQSEYKPEAGPVISEEERTRNLEKLRNIIGEN
ncbi:MAG: hypothetical protein EHM36_00700 [Deltaproteobacteria bacterium]|nr:MAG: hypothetical protein EHM36_00700 [Deltaproteobacteria bacterium]